MSPLPQDKAYTYGDLMEWNDGKRYELYNGALVALASPSDVHQEISGELFAQLHDFLKGKPCTVYAAPFDVRLFEQEDDTPEDSTTVVQPDLMVVCDKSKVDRHGVHGAPDLVIEITSPSTRAYDRVIKLNLYQRAGVREYWIVSPEEQSAVAYVLDDNGAFVPTALGGVGESMPVNVLDGCKIDLTPVFQ